MKLLKIADVADRLNCSESFAYGLISQGRLRCYRLGKGQGGLRVSEEQLTDYLASVEQCPLEEEPEEEAFRRHVR